jgi:hypothetical protein
VDVDRRAILAALAIAIILSVLGYLYVDSGSPFRVCVPTSGEETTRQQQAIKALDSVADVGIKLATALVGLGAAVLLGFKKSGIVLTTSTRVYILLATICFIEAALYAVLWRLRVAELWFNDCLSLIAEPRLQYRYNAHFVLFLIGLLFLGALIANEALKKPISPTQRNEEYDEKKDEDENNDVKEGETVL